MWCYHHKVEEADKSFHYYFPPRHESPESKRILTRQKRIIKVKEDDLRKLKKNKLMKREETLAILRPKGKTKSVAFAVKRTSE